MNSLATPSLKPNHKTIQDQLAALDDDLVHVNSTNDVNRCMSHFANSQLMQDWLSDYDLKGRRVARESNALLQQYAQGIYARSPYMRATVAKKYGYPGDFEVLEAVYNQQSLPDTSVQGQYFDAWSFSTALPAAVRQRKDILRDLLTARLQRGDQQVLSIAAGAAREIRELPAEALSHASIDLLDFDPAGFEFFSGHASTECQGACDFIHADAFKAHKCFEEPRYDLIYSFGLYDYVGDRLMSRSISQALSALKPGGKFVFALKDRHFYPAWLYAFFCDWHFVARDRKDGERIAQTNGLIIDDIISTEGKAVNVYVCHVA